MQSKAKQSSIRIPYLDIPLFTFVVLNHVDRFFHVAQDKVAVAVVGLGRQSTNVSLRTTACKARRAELLVLT